MAEDDLLDPFASEEFRSVVGTPSDPYAPDLYREGSSWTDYAKSTGSRVAGIGADLSATLRSLGESDEDPDSKSARAVTALGKFGQSLFSKIEEDVAGSMTETSQRDLAATFSDPNFWSLNALALKATNMAPDIAVAVIPATRLSGSMLAAATATQGGILSASSVVDDLYKATDAMSDEELAAEVPLYKELRDGGMSEEAARRNYNAVLRGNRPLIVGAISALTAGLSPGGQAARLTSEIAQGVPTELAEGVSKRVVKGITEGVASEGVQEGSEDYFTQQGRVAGQLQPEIDIPQVVESALTGAVIGGVLGGGISAVPRPKRADQPVDNSDIDVNLTAPIVPDSTDANPPLEPVPGVDTKATPGVVTPDEVVMNTGATTAQNMEAIAKFNKQYSNLTPEQQVAVDDGLASRGTRKNRNAKKVVAPTTVVEPVQATGPDAAQAVALDQAKPPEPITSQVTPPVVQPVVNPEPTVDAAVTGLPEDAPQPTVDQVAQTVQEIPGTAQEIPVETSVPVEVAPVSTVPVEASPAPALAEPAPIEPVSIEPVPVPQPVVTGPRILQDLTKVDEEQAIARENAKAVTRNIKEMETPVSTEPAGAKLSKAQIAQRDSTRTSSLDIANRYKPAEVENKLFSSKPVEQVEAMRSIKKRVDEMVTEADTLGVVLPKSFKNTADKAQQYNPETLLLMEAKRLARLPKAGLADYRRFTTREFDLRAGALDEVLADRREEGDRANRKGTGVNEERTAALDETQNGEVNDNGSVDDRGDDDIDTSNEEEKVSVPSPEEELIAKEDEGLSAVRERTARQIAKDKVPQSVEKALDEAMEAYTVPKADRKAPVVAKKRKVVIPPKIAPTPAPVTSEGNTPRPNLAERIKAAREKTNTAPTTAQAQAGNYAKGRVSVQGMGIAIENPKGSTRTNKDPAGPKWSVKLKNDYGYIEGTKGADGDPIDVYVGPTPDSANVFVIDQLDLPSGNFDEHKVMLGFKDEQAAVRAYDAAFSDDMGILRIGNISRMTVDEFKAWIAKNPAERQRVSVTEAAEARSLMIELKNEPKERTTPKIDKTANGSFLIDAATKQRGEILQTTTAQEMLWRLKFDHLAGANRVIAGTMRTKMTQLVGDVPIHIMTGDDIKRTTGTKAQEVYGYHWNDPNNEYIVISADILGNKELLTHAVMHEIAHAATIRGLEKDKALVQIVKQIANSAFIEIDKMAAANKDASSYAFTNVKEFIAEAVSNPEFQNILATIPVPDYMVKQLNLDASIKTMWDAFIHAIRRALGLPRNSHSLLEAVMRATEMTMRPREADALATLDTEPNLLRSFMEGNQRGVKRAITDILKITEADHLAPTQGNPQLMGFRTFDSIARAADRYFPGNPVVRTIANLIEGQRVAAIKEVDRAAPIIQKLHDLEKKYRGKTWEDFASLVHDETMSGVFADKPLADQKHISKQGSRDSWARKQHPDLSARFAKLPDDLKQARTEAMDFFRAKQNEMSLKLIRNRIVTLFDTPDPDGLAQRIHDRTVTDADKELMGEAYDVIAAAGSLGRVDGPYVPLMRRGNFVVKGKLPVTLPGNNATTISENEFEFTSKDDATKFADSQAGRPTIRTIYVDKATGSQTGSENGKTVKLSKEDMNVEARYRVVVQNRHMEMFDTMKEARMRVAELRAKGFDVDDAVPRQFDNYGIQADALSVQMRKMNTIMERKADDRGYTPEQKADLMNTLNEMSINLLGATRIQSRSLPRRYVAGASKDFVRNTTEYAHAAGNYIAKLDFRPKLDAALKEMDDAVRANGSDGLASGRTTIQNEVLRRITSLNPISENKSWNAITSRILALSFIDKLMSPSYSVINATQPMMLSAPYLASHYGIMRAYGALGRAYADIGSLKAIREGFDATMSKTKGGVIPTDPVSLIRARLKNSGERELIDILVERGTIDTDSGLEVSSIVRSTKGIVGKLDGGIGYLEGIARQMPKTIEAINRTTVAIASYRLEMERSGDKARAVQFAQDTLNLTQFNYSASNTAPIMNHPALRLALQFKKYGISMYQFLGENAAIMLDKTKSREERIVAIKALSYTIGMHVLIAGAMGLPTEPIKLVVTAANGLGITDWTWGDVEDAQRKALADLFGAQFGEIVARGIPRAMGIDLSTRMGIDTLMGPLGEPRSNEAQDWKAYLWDAVSGAPAGLVTDWARGVNDINEGEWARALERLVPMKAFSDSVKAYRTMTEGTISEKTGKQTMSPYTPGEAVVRALGFSPRREAESFERSSTYYRNKERYEADVTEFKRSWVEASPAARGRVWVEIQKWNRKQPLEARIKLSELRRYQKKLKDDMKKTKEGILARRRDEKMLKGIDAVYNFEPN
jgi:hypothetical protein